MFDAIRLKTIIEPWILLDAIKNWLNPLRKLILLFKRVDNLLFTFRLHCIDNFPRRPPIFLFRVFAFLEIVLSTSNVEQWSVLPTGSFTVDMLSIVFNFRCCRIQTHRANDSIPELLVGCFIERIYLNKSDYKHL